MDFVKKALMVLGVLWLIGFVMMFALGFGAYKVATSEGVQTAAREAVAEQQKVALRRRNDQINSETAYADSAYGEAPEDPYSGE